MFRKVALMVTLLVLVSGCDPLSPTKSTDEAVEADVTAAAQADSEGLTRRAIPSEDPGPPFYTRTTTILDQLFHTEDWIAIPFYRDPSCVPDDFNILEHFDFPGPDAPGAFACPLVVNGFLLIEPDAPQGTFPRQVVLRGDQVPVWFVPWTVFESEMADGVVTMAELQAMPVMKGTARRFHETLKPRAADHIIVINSTGTLDEDGRDFQFSVMHRQDQTQSIKIRFR